jgi:hypothetical protein
MKQNLQNMTGQIFINTQKKQFPPNTPESCGNAVQMNVFVNANHAAK